MVVDDKFVMIGTTTVTHCNTTVTIADDTFVIIGVSFSPTGVPVLLLWCHGVVTVLVECFTAVSLGVTVLLHHQAPVTSMTAPCSVAVTVKWPWYYTKNVFLPPKPLRPTSNNYF
jgi:hypothetical protein